jgi:hypothetical protein
MASDSKEDSVCSTIRILSPTAFLKLARFRGVSVKSDPRFHKKVKEFEFPSFIERGPLAIEGIVADAFDPWVRRELAKLTDDDFVPDLVIGFLRGRTLDSQELARTLEPSLGVAAVDFVVRLWPLVLDAKKSEVGIPSAIIAESRAAVASKMKEAAVSESSSDEVPLRRKSRPSDSSDEERRHHHHHHHRRHSRVSSRHHRRD